MAKRKNRNKQSREARGTGILEAQASAEQDLARQVTNPTTSNPTPPNPAPTSQSKQSSSSSSAQTIPTTHESMNADPGASSREHRESVSSDSSEPAEETVRPQGQQTWGTGAAGYLFRDPNPAAIFARPTLNGPPEEETRHITLDYGEGFNDVLHNQTITITLTGPGWGGVRNADVLIALLDKGIRPEDIVGFWKAANHRHMYVTLKSYQAVRYAQNLGGLQLGDAYGEIRGTERTLEIKLHWVPAWMEESYLEFIMHLYGEVTHIERETLDIGGMLFPTGTVSLKLRVKKEKEAEIPCVLKFHGPVQGSVLVSVKGRPQRCLSCWQHGHARRFCDRRREVRTNETRRDPRFGQRMEGRPMQTLGHGDHQTQRKMVEDQAREVRQNATEELITWEEDPAPTRPDHHEREIETEPDIIPPTQPPNPPTTQTSVIPDTQTTIPDTQTDTEHADETSTLAHLLEPTDTPGGLPDPILPTLTSTTDETDNDLTTQTSLTDSPTPRNDTATISQTSSLSSATGDHARPASTPPPATPATPATPYLTPPSQTLSTPSSSIMQGVVSQAELFSQEDSDDDWETQRRRRPPRPHYMPAMVERPRSGVASKMRRALTSTTAAAGAMVEAIKRRATPPGDQPPDKRHQP